MTLLTTNKLTLTLVAGFLFGTATAALATLPGLDVRVREMAWITGIFSAVWLLLSCYFLVERGRHRTLLMLLAVTVFCFALPLLMVLLIAGD